MPQEIRVLKCFKCDIFQGDFVKKAKTWQCKICGEKQSIMQEFGRGSGTECRQHIQKLNIKMRDEETASAQRIQNQMDLYEQIAENVENLSKEQIMPKVTESKWSQFKNDEDQEDNQNKYNNSFVSTQKNNTKNNTNKTVGNSSFFNNEEKQHSNSKNELFNHVNSDPADYYSNQLNNKLQQTNTKITENVLKRQVDELQDEKFSITNSQKKSKWSNYVIDDNENE